MNQVQKLLLEAEISKWIKWNNGSAIEAKFFTLIGPHLDKDAFIPLFAKYAKGIVNPEYKNVANGQLDWNVHGINFLSELLYALLELLVLPENN